MTGLISVGFLEAKIQLYESEPVLYSQGGDRQEAPQTDLVRISPLQLSSLLHVNLLALLILNPHYTQDQLSCTYCSIHTRRFPALTPKFLEAHFCCLASRSFIIFLLLLLSFPLLLLHYFGESTEPYKEEVKGSAIFPTTLYLMMNQ